MRERIFFPNSNAFAKYYKATILNNWELNYFHC